MRLRVMVVNGGYRLAGDGFAVDVANRWLAHLEAREFSPRTVRAYAFDVLNFARFLVDAGIGVGDVGPTDVFDWLAWQREPLPSVGARVVRLQSRRGAAPATMNRRVAAVRSLFDFAVMSGEVVSNPVPSPRRSGGLRTVRRGLLGHVAGRRTRSDGRLVRQARPLPESLPSDEVAVFLADLETHRDRAIVLLMLLGGLRASEVRTLCMADVDVGMRQVTVCGKGGKQRTVPVDRAFFTELGSYLRVERPAGLAIPECFVVLRGPTAGGAMTEAGLRRVFRTHRARSGAQRVRPHRLRHTFGTELAAAGIDLLVLRDLMGHSHAETTASYVHPSAELIAAEWSRARAGQR
jgi:site-specific recombinase XerD